MANIYDMTDTWNNGATTFTAIKMDVSDSASAANSLLLDLKVDGVTKASIDKAGNLTANITLTAIDNVPIGATTPSTGAFTTLTTDGLTVDGDSVTANAQNAMTLEFNNATGIISADRTGGNYASLQLKTTDGSAPKLRQAIDFNGDISFYEDTGTTAKFYWDASAESLGIGTSSPVASLDVVAGADDRLLVTNSSGDTFLSSVNAANTAYNGLALNGSEVKLFTNASERMRITSTGTLITNHNIREKIYNLTGTDINPVNGSVQYKTLAATTTFTESLADGDSVILRLAGGDTYAVTWPTMTWVTSAGNAAPTLGGSDVVVLWQESSTVYGAYVGSYA